MDELKILMDLRKISTLFKSAAKNKVEQILKRLGSREPSEWTKDDQELNVYIKEYCKAVMRWNFIINKWSAIILISIPNRQSFVVKAFFPFIKMLAWNCNLINWKVEEKTQSQYGHPY